MADALSPDDRLLAGELALHLLDGEEGRAAEERRTREPAFAAEVLAWNRRLSPMFDAIAPATPDAALWRSIEARLDGAPVAANDPGIAGAPVDRLRRTVRVWRTAAVSAMAVAAALVLALLLRPDPQLPPAIQPPPVAPTEAIVAQLSDAEGGAILTTRLDLTDDRLRVRPVDIPAGEGEPELWVIPADKTPRSLGLVARDRTSTILLPANLRDYFVDGSTLALTLEDAEGAPHAAPTGTILATARITRL